MSDCTFPGRNNPLRATASSDSVSRSRARSGPRNQSCAGMSKPSFLRVSTAPGSLSFINFRRTYFKVEPWTFKFSGREAANSTMRWLLAELGEKALAKMLLSKR